MLHGWLVPCYGTESQAPFPKFESKVPRLLANAMFWVIGVFFDGVFEPHVGFPLHLEMKLRRLEEREWRCVEWAQ